MGIVIGRVGLAALVAVALSGVPTWAQGGQVAALDFQNDTKDWTPQKGTLATEELQNGANKYLQLEAAAGEMARLNSPIFKSATEKFVEIQFRYRSTVANSSQDVGSWVYLPFMDGKGQRVSFEAVPLAGATGWTEVRKRFTLPEGSAQWQVQLRLQNTGGRVDFDDVQLRYVDGLQSAGKDEEPTSDNLKKVAEWKLEAGNLKGTTTLPDVSKGETPGAWAFVLPDEYCGKANLTYDLAIEFTSGWNANETKEAFGLVGLGRNMHGYAPPAFTMMVWDGSQIFSRLTAANHARAQFIGGANDVKAGQTYRVRSLVTASSLETYWNRKRLGNNSLAGEFLWPKGQKFFVGCEDMGLAPLKGQIKSFSLTIWEQRTRAGWIGGPDAGYFQGVKKPRLALDFPAKNGLERKTAFSITDLTGKTVFNGGPTSQSATTHALDLPALPYGWYQLNATVADEKAPGDGGLKTTRAFVLLPPAPERDPAVLSSLGITEEIGLAPDRFNAATAEILLRRSALMGIRWWRLWVQWDVIEPEPGKYQWEILDKTLELARKNGIELYVCLQGGANEWQAYGGGVKPPWAVMSRHVYAPKDIEDWKRYVRAISTHLKGKVRYWQVWNEPDARNGFFPYTADKYVEVLKASAEVLRDVDKSNVVGLGGFAAAFASNRLDMTSHTEKDPAWGMAEFFNLKPEPYFDLLDNHYYSVHEPGQSWEKQSTEVGKMRDWLAKRGISKTLWNSETSMYSAPGNLAGTRGGWAGVPYLTDEAQAQRLIELHVQSLAVGIEKTFWYGVRGDIGVMESDFSPKASYATHAILAGEIRGMKFDREIPAGSGSRAYVFTPRSGKGNSLLVAWGLAGNELKLPSAPTKVRNWMGNSVAVEKGSQTIKLDSHPVYVELAVGK